MAVQWLSRSHKTLNIQVYQSFGTDSTVCTHVQQQESNTPNCESSIDVNPTIATAQHPLASDSACTHSTDTEQSSSSHISQNSDPCTRSSDRDCVDIMIVSATL